MNTFRVRVSNVMLLPKFSWSIEDLIAENRISKNEVEELREWMKLSGYPTVSDEMIAIFMIACERDIDASKSTIKAYFFSKKSSPDIFNDRDIHREDLKLALKTADIGILPFRTPDNCCIHMAKLRDTNYRNFDFISLLKLSFMVCDVSLNLDTPPKGVILILDAEGIGFMHLTRLPLAKFKVALEFLQRGFQMKLEGIHVINANTVIKHLMFITKPFIATEVYNSVHIYTKNSIGDLWKFIPKECFLKKYGGGIDSTIEELSEEMIKKYKDCQEFYLNEEKLRKQWENNL